MMTADALRAQLAVSTIEAWMNVAEYAHAQGIDTVLFPGVARPLTPREARNRVAGLAANRQLRGEHADRLRARAGDTPKNWSAKQATDLIADVESVETLAWASSLRRTPPSWTGITPAPWSFALRLLTTPARSWGRGVRVRPLNVLVEANRTAAAWRWRTYAEAYRDMLKDQRREMRVFARGVVELVPWATKFGSRHKWFVPAASDFPVGELRCNIGDLSQHEREELNVVTRSRSWAIRRVLDLPNSDCDIDVNEAWRIMVGKDHAPAHPVWPF